jgi:hypothetical protein
MDSVHGLWTAASVGPPQTKDSCSAALDARGPGGGDDDGSCCGRRGWEGDGCGRAMR